jgi:hypothetical protein
MPDLDLTEQYGYVSLVQISPQCLDLDGPRAFCTLMDELQTALKEDEDDGLYHNRTSLLEAYTDGCLYGLYIPWDELDSAKRYDMFKLKDPIFMATRFCMPRLLACCVVIDKKFDHSTMSVCRYLWTAKRARKQGMATYLLDEVLVNAAEDILPEAEAFWSKYLARVEVGGDEIEAV